MSKSRKRFKIAKLVRDHLPHRLQEKGISSIDHVLNEEDYRLSLLEKLKEEALEVIHSTCEEELTEEMADLLEVVYAIAKLGQIDLETIEKVRLQKREEKGGFENRIYSSFVEMDETNPYVAHYENKAEQYPEVKHDEHCIFCQLQIENSPRITHRFKHCYVMKDAYPVSQGHLLIIPYEHTENWFTAREAVRLEIMEVVKKMREESEVEYHPDGYNFGANCGKAAGQTVFHLHLHFIPRYEGDTLDARGGVRGVISEKQKYHH